MEMSLDLFKGLWTIFCGIILFVFRNQIFRRFYRKPAPWASNLKGTPGASNLVAFDKESSEKSKKIISMYGMSGICIILVGIIFLVDPKFNYPWLIWIVALILVVSYFYILRRNK